MADPVFITGAGFGVDAGACVGDREAARYPLVGDLLDACFDLPEAPAGQSVEDLFQQAINTRNRGPLEQFAQLLQAADHYLTPHLSPGGYCEANPYRTFLDDFREGNPLLTFNYDSLLELLLLRLGRWRPEDGYGVEVSAKIEPRLVEPPQLPATSSIAVLHLHGTFCVYPSTFFIERKPGRELDLIRHRDEPEFLFDPDMLGNDFFPFRRIQPGRSYRGVLERVIVPIPNKAEGLKGDFVVRMHDQATSAIRAANCVVWIGYSFNEHDTESFSHLLRAGSSAPHVIVDPTAEELVSRLSASYATQRFEPVPLGFAEWVAKSYPGL